MIYIVIIIYLFFLIIFFERNIKLEKLGNFFYVISCLLLISLSGLRNYVGGDSLGYMWNWDSLPKLNELNFTDLMSAYYQPFWYILSALVKSIYNDFVLFQFVHAAILNISIFYIINKYSKYRFTAILLYFLISYPYFNFEILRESLAVCFFLFSISAFTEKKWIKYYIFVTIAFLFHNSAILLFFFPLFYPFFTKKINFRQIIPMVILGLLFFNPKVLSMIVGIILPDKASLFNFYATTWEYSLYGILLALLKSIAILLLITLREKQVQEQSEVTVGLKIYFFISIATLILPIANRLTNYEQLFLIIGLADLLWRVTRKLFIIKAFIILFFSFNAFYYYYRDTYKSTGYHARFIELFQPYYSIYDNVPLDIQKNRENIYLQTLTKP